MADIHAPVAARGNIFSGFFESIFNGLTAFAEANSRVHEVERMNEMTDEQLSKMGLQRTDIVRYVFRDRLFL